MSQTKTLAELKSKAMSLGIKGTSSRTKYTKHNKDKLIEDIIQAERDDAVVCEKPRVWSSVKEMCPSDPPREPSLDPTTLFAVVLGSFAALTLGSFYLYPRVKRIEETEEI